MLTLIFYFITAILFIQAVLVVALLNYNDWINSNKDEEIDLLDWKRRFN